jgi:hypothetical protein
VHVVSFHLATEYIHGNANADHPAGQRVGSEYVTRWKWSAHGFTYVVGPQLQFLRRSEKVCSARYPALRFSGADPPAYPGLGNRATIEDLVQALGPDWHGKLAVIEWGPPVQRQVYRVESGKVLKSQ